MEVSTDHVTLNMTIQEVTTTMEGTLRLDRMLPYLHTSPLMATIYLIVMATMLISGVIGNIFIIGAYVVNKSLRTLGSEFVVNLALADLCVTGLADPMCILGVTHGKKFFIERPQLCQLVACLCLSACFCAFLSLSMMTLNRYVYVCHNQRYHTLFKRKLVLVLCFAVWVTAFLLESPNFIGWGGHYFDEKNLQCIWDRRASLSYTLMVTVVLISGPLVLMTLAYIRIFLRIRNSKRSIVAHASGNLSQIEAKKKEWMETLRAARSIFVVLIAFIVCWTPYVLVVIIDFQDRFPISIHLWTTLLAHMHSSLNVFIYGLTNPHYLDGYWHLVRLEKCFGDRPNYLTSWTKTSSDSDKKSSIIKSNNKIHPDDATANTKNTVVYHS